MRMVRQGRQLIISRDAFDTRVALLEDARVAELYVERHGSPSLVGNIYKGRVESVLAGMDAAFVDIGIGRNGFLYVDEIVSQAAMGDRTGETGVEVGAGGGPRGRKGRRITNLLRKGKEVVVQVTRDPMGGKGPRLTTQLAIAGRHVVFLPYAATRVGVSRRLGDGERERLRSACRALDLGQGGVIVRTAAEGGVAEAIGRDLRLLQRVWGSVERHIPACSAPSLVYEEAALPLRALRDLMGSDRCSVVVDDPVVCRRLVNYMRATAPQSTSSVELYTGETPLFERYGLEREIAEALKRRVPLPSGGYLVIDHTEAMTVIDVNTGSYVGRRFLEDTTTKTNLEACKEVVHQLRLRDIGGIIVIDFIDMVAPSNREAVLTALQRELSQDRTKSYVVEISPLGLVEMTRQNVTLGLREVVTAPCPHCGGGGRVMSEESVLAAVERRLRGLAASSALESLAVEVHPLIAQRLTAEGMARTQALGDPRGAPSLLESLETDTGMRVVLQPADGDVPLDHVRPLGQ